MKHSLGLFDYTNSHLLLGFFLYKNKVPNNMSKYLKYNTWYLQRLWLFTYYNVTMPMVVVLLVKSKSILSYEIADSGLQLNVITYSYKKCNCSEICKNISYHLIILINILQLHNKELHRHATWDVSVILAFILLSFREEISYNISVYFSIHNICINFFFPLIHNSLQCINTIGRPCIWYPFYSLLFIIDEKSKQESLNSPDQMWQDLTFWNQFLFQV
jgi:hypothetical protein